eukprot:14226895-Alexandrium_andersonii.AAC.1
MAAIMTLFTTWADSMENPRFKPPVVASANFRACRIAPAMNRDKHETHKAQHASQRSARVN